MAMAKVNSEIEIPISRVAGVIKTPRLCRIPMLRLSMTEAPIRMGRPDLMKRWVFINGVYGRDAENPSHVLMEFQL
jgi:hypothetical protein